MVKIGKKEKSDQLYKAIMQLKDEQECYEFVQDLCTMTELRSMEQRFEVASLLNDGMIYNEILERVANAAVAHNIVNAIARSPYTRMIDPQYRFGLIEQDPDDNKFVDCAIIAGADYIVSEDAHFRILADIPFPSVAVIRLDEFIKDLGLG